MGATFATRPAPHVKVPHVKPLLAIDASTLRAPLAGREPRVGYDERAPVPPAFVAQAADDLTPTGPANVTSKVAVLH